MRLNKRFISMFLSMCVLVTLMFQSVHTYTHLVTDYLSETSHHTKHDKYANHHSDDCQICHFTLSPFTTVSTDVIHFYSTTYYPKLNVAYHVSLHETSFNFVQLRGPPVFV